MAYIETIGPGDAEGGLKRLYDEAIRRAGRVYGILRLQSLNPPVLAASLELYKAIMFGPSPLTRVEREAIAVTVSRVNECFY
ncbi:MAG TPA: peroxidase [Planctomycetota bacterium]|nr:peroxidase [Planctomycetota bacterium]